MSISENCKFSDDTYILFVFWMFRNRKKLDLSLARFSHF